MNDNALRDSIELLKTTWLHRKGNEVPAAIIDTVNVLWKHSDLRPLVVKKTRNDNGWFFVLNLPPGISYHDFKAKENYFQDASGGAVHISKRGKAIYMEVMTGELKTLYPYKLWDASRYGHMYLPMPIGLSPRGEITIDLIDVPHIFAAGETLYGKSNLLHVIAVTALLHRDIYLIVLDFKLAEFAYLADYGILVNDIPAARKVFSLLNPLLNERLKQLRDARVRKVQKFKGKMPLVLVIVDELAEMQDEECQLGLERLARLGRAVGIHIIAATQRPSSTLYSKFGDIKALFPCRICFLVADQINSNMILDSDRASLLPAVPGRAIYKWGIDMVEVQTYYIDPDEEAPRLLLNKHGERRVKHYGLLESPKRLPPR